MMDWFKAGLLSFLLLGTGCGPERTAIPTGPGESTAITAAPPSNGNTYATWAVDDLAGLSSDGGGLYVNNVCGVETTIFAVASGDAILNVPSGRNSCRSLSVNLGGSYGVRSAWFVNVRQVIQLVAGNSRLQDLRIYVNGLKQCTWVEYNLTTGSQILVTAGTDGLGRRTWTAESTGSHAAGCYKSSKGGYAWDGIVRSVPMRVTITQL